MYTPKSIMEGQKNKMHIGVPTLAAAPRVFPLAGRFFGLDEFPGGDKKCVCVCVCDPLDLAARAIQEGPHSR